MVTEFKFTEVDIAKYSLEPNDILVFKVQQRLNDRDFERLTAHIKRVVGDGVRILILDEDVDLDVISPDAQVG